MQNYQSINHLLAVITRGKKNTVIQSVQMAGTTRQKLHL